MLRELETASRSRHRVPPRAASLGVLALVAFLVLRMTSGSVADPASEVDRVRLAADRQEISLGLRDAAVWVSEAAGGPWSDGVAVTGHLPDLPADQTFQIWTLRSDGTPARPGPVLRPTPDGGYATAWITPLEGVVAILISVEPWDADAPHTGSSSPTEVMATAELT